MTGSPFPSSDIVGFVATSNAQRAKAFYKDLLGLRLIFEDQFALVFDANGTMLRVTSVDKVITAPYTLLGWHVPDIAAAAKYLADSGVQLERFEGLGQDEGGIWRAPGGTSIAWFKESRRQHAQHLATLSHLSSHDHAGRMTECLLTKSANWVRTGSEHAQTVVLLHAAASPSLREKRR